MGADSRATRLTNLVGRAGLVILMLLVIAPGRSVVAQDSLPPPEAIQPGAPMGSPLGRAAEVPVGVRIKDITMIEGHRNNAVTGIGLVTGLAATGGRSQLTQQMAKNLFQRMGLNANAIQQLPTNSISMVSVTAEIPAFVKPGEKIPATVSIVDDATSLRNGQLELTELKGVDGKTYALAFGTVAVGGFSAGGQGASITKNSVTVGQVDATVEVCVDEEPAFEGNFFTLLLKNKDNATAWRIATEINRYFPQSARALDAGTVRVYFPRSYQHNKIDFVVTVNELRVVPDTRARVVIDARNGTIVAGHNVRISQTMIANDNLVISTTESPVVSQPAPFSGGTTEEVPRTQISALEENGRYNVLPEITTVGDLARALNQLGISASDMVTIFRTLERQGALQAELIYE